MTRATEHAAPVLCLAGQADKGDVFVDEDHHWELGQRDQEVVE